MCPMDIKQQGNQNRSKTCGALWVSGEGLTSLGSPSDSNQVTDLVLVLMIQGNFLGSLRPRPCGNPMWSSPSAAAHAGI